MDWLAGTSIAGTGRVIAFPKSLTGRELLGFGMDVLGLNYAGLLTRLGKKYGTEKVRKAEGQLALLQQAKGGLHKLNDFRHMDNQARDGVITAARNYALQSVAQQAVVWASSFAASGGLIPVAKTAFNLISTVLQNASTFQSLGQTVLGSIADIANGRTAAAANKVEQNLVRVMGLVMKFLSKMLGLDKISGAIRKGLAALQKPINTVIDRIVASKPVAAFFSKFQAGKQAVSNAVQQGTRNIWAALRGAGKSLTGKKQVTGTQHHLWVEIRGESPVFIMASNPLPLREQLVQMEKEAAAFLSGSEKAKVDKAQAAASALVDQGVKDMLDYIRTRPRNPNPAADEAWLRANAQVIRGKLKTIGQATITKVNATIAPAVQILDKHVMPVKDLTAVVKSAGGIVDFLTTLASGGKVGGIDQKTFHALWGRKTGGSFDHRAKIIALFRAAMPGNHEWLPSDLIDEVVSRDLTNRQLNQATQWVQFQHQTRTLTQHVVFKKERALGGKSIPQGHSGAVYFQKVDASGNVDYKPETDGQDDFHDELRAAFRAGGNHAAVVSALKSVAVKSLWDGKSAFSNAFHKRVYWRARTGEYVSFATEATRIRSSIAAQYSIILGAIK